MKMTSKRRKLLFIRRKNRFRLGATYKEIFKISSEMVSDLEFIKEFSNRQSLTTLRRLKIQLNLDFRFTGCGLECFGKDRFDGLATLVLYFNVKHN